MDLINFKNRERGEEFCTLEGMDAFPRFVTVSGLVLLFPLCLRSFWKEHVDFFFSPFFGISLL